MSNHKPLGCLDFLDFIYHGHPEYSLIAVRAPFEATLKTWIEFCQQRETKQKLNPNLSEIQFKPEISYQVLDVKVERYQNLRSRPSQESEYVAPGNLILKVRDNDWTIIVRSLFILTGKEIQDVPQETQALSQLLQTQALDFMDEDTSSAIGYTFYDKGEKVESFCSWDWLSFESKIRPVPNNWEKFSGAEDYGLSPDMPNQYDTPNHFDREQFINDFFTEQGIYLPACYHAWNNSTLIIVESEDNEPDPAHPTQSVHERFTEDGDRIRFRFPERSNDTLELAVEKQSENTIERADLVIIETTLADEPDRV